MTGVSLASQGMSSRAIAPVVGASHQTVQNDLGDAGVKDLTPATGLDGKTYSRPEPALGERLSAISRRLDAAYEARREAYEGPGWDSPECAAAEAELEAAYRDLRAWNAEARRTQR